MKKSFLALIGMSLLTVSCNTMPLPEYPKIITVTFKQLEVVKDCDEGIAGQGEFFYQFSVNGQVVMQKTEAQAIGANDGDIISLGNTTKNVTINSALDSWTMGRQVYESDNPAGIMTVGDTTITVSLADNFGITPAGSVRTYDMNPSSTCRVILTYDVK